MREPTEMELIVAEAMYENALERISHVSFAEYNGRENWIKSARAAIRAMREPTIGMVAAFEVVKNDIGYLSGPPGAEGYWLWESDAAKTAWSAMIDAASPEEA